MSIKGRIKIIKNGPYVVTGNVPLSENIITPRGMEYELKKEIFLSNLQMGKSMRSEIGWHCVAVVNQENSLFAMQHTL
ncbi:hypothetical protein SAMN02745691_01502 [Parasporobacterium paucivorans DSM 15970]|uniref:Uncharacterized protein n=1 Tax=Parasporobacterium paucivorans DSM 15970 TaxID=1122934 RepID=A0A1M6HA48_9FIRM|nr:hypothetical protein [Parasporobacterium paucivorans]SHJ19036.1 hypothetical protein SAMN02745691_01502 [Parasporobacterium paucivorans DSM 15970]